MKRSGLIKGYLFAICSAVIYGCMPLMSKLIYAEGVNPMSLVFLRNLLALPVLAVLALLEGQTLRIPLKALPGISLISILGCSATPILLIFSYQFMDSGTATVFHYIYPAAVILGGMVFLRKKTQVGHLIGVALCAVGIFLFYDPAMPISWQGSVLSIASGLTFAAYVLLLPIFPYKKQMGNFLFSFYVVLIGSISTGILCLATGQLTLPATLVGWVLCLGFAIGVSAVAVVLFQQAAFTIGGERTSILGTLEPITSVFIGVIVFHETVGLRTVIGSVLVVSASIVIAAMDMRKQKA